jgi:hypothetical protein
MLDGVPVSVVVQGGAFAVLLMLIVWFYRATQSGRLISGRVLADARADWQARIDAAERREELWRTAYLSQFERGVIRDDQVSELLEMSRTQAAIWEAVQRLAAQRGAP